MTLRERLLSLLSGERVALTRFVCGKCGLAWYEHDGDVLEHSVPVRCPSCTARWKEEFGFSMAVWVKVE
jgi:predicted Zn-ribbon and HTH transcriptional regulator